MCTLIATKANDMSSFHYVKTSQIRINVLASIWIVGFTDHGFGEHLNLLIYDGVWRRGNKWLQEKQSSLSLRSVFCHAFTCAERTVFLLWLKSIHSLIDYSNTWCIWDDLLKERRVVSPRTCFPAS